MEHVDRFAFDQVRMLPRQSADLNSLLRWNLVGCEPTENDGCECRASCHRLLREARSREVKQTRRAEHLDLGVTASEQPRGSGRYLTAASRAVGKTIGTFREAIGMPSDHLTSMTITSSGWRAAHR